MNKLAKVCAFVSVFSLIVLGGWILGVHAARPNHEVTPAKKPNIVFILTDDLATNLVPYMPNVLAMQKEGTSFSNYFVTDSLCCPSRSSIFTGKLPHNTGVFTNTKPDGGYEAFLAHGNEPFTFAVALQRGGYKTAMLGKYLNGYYPGNDGRKNGKKIARRNGRKNDVYDDRHNSVPVGWNEWDVAGDVYREFDYVLNQNGRVVKYGSEPRDYLTDVLAELADAFIRKSSPGPFFIEIATFAPHAPYIPAPRDADKFPGVSAPRSAAFGVRPGPDAPNWLKAIPPLRPIDIKKINQGFRMRAQSVQAVDKMIGQIRSTLAALGDDNTYVIFSSDNGLHMGEYSLRPGKMTPFETDIRVPLVVVGPGVPKGHVVDAIVENIDLCPTFTDLGGISSPTSPDGHSLVPLFHGSPAEDWRRAALIEHHRPSRFRSDPDAPIAHSANPTTYEALRTENALYVEYEGGEVGYYDLSRDPDELKNVAPSLSAARRQRLHEMLRANKECKGAEACWNAQHLTVLATQQTDTQQQPEAAIKSGIREVSPDRIASVAGPLQKIRIKIMPLGDSITFGSPDRSYGGYEHLLGKLLIDDGYRTDFVGSQRSGNEGHPGWTIPQLKNGIDSNGWLKTYQPEIILLHIGTNDLRQGGAASAPDNLSALLDDILERLPQTHVIVAQIIPFRHGPGPVLRSYNAAIADIVASKGPRVSMVNMQSILSPSDYADGIHPNAGGYDKMAHAWEPAIRAVLSGSSRHVGSQASPSPSAGEYVKTAVSAAPQGTATVSVIRYVPGSTHKLEQLVGEEDKERHQPTLSRTFTRYQLQGTDLGYSFEHDGRIYFLFGDTVGRLDRALDTIATTDARDPERGVRLDFLTVGSDYLTIQPPGIHMGAFEVPVSGISLGGQMYVVVSTNHSMDRTTDRSVLTKFTPPATFKPLRTISQLPAGKFIKMSMHIEPGPMAGMPPGGLFVLIWGTGVYRKSDAYLSIVPISHFETGEGTRYFAGLDAAGSPTWSDKEFDAKPIVNNGTMGDLSVTWCKDLGLWLMTYDSRPPASRGILFSYSRAPWGPWSQPQVLFDSVRDGALGKYIHNPRSNPDDGLAGPVIGKGRANPGAVHGGAYAPYVVECWTRVQGSELDLYYVLSTWNPYVVVLMKSRMRVDPTVAEPYLQPQTQKNRTIHPSWITATMTPLSARIRPSNIICAPVLP